MHFLGVTQSAFPFEILQMPLIFFPPSVSPRQTKPAEHLKSATVPITTDF